MHAYRNALVTGASSGIGAALAGQLAAEGCDLIVVARRGDRLEALASDLRQRHGVEVEVLVADLVDADQMKLVTDRLADPRRPVELLVNNAGFATQGEFVGSSLAEEEREIQLNVLALVQLTHAVLPGMVERQYGGVLNVSSLAGEVSNPSSATYNATKAFVTSFSQSVRMEVGPSGVHVTALLPGFTRTEFQQRAGLTSGRLPEFAWLNVDLVARAGVRAVRSGDALCVPGPQYAASSGLLRVLPRRVIHKVVPHIWRRI